MEKLFKRVRNSQTSMRQIILFAVNAKSMRGYDIRMLVETRQLSLMNKLVIKVGTFLAEWIAWN